MAFHYEALETNAHLWAILNEKSLQNAQVLIVHSAFSSIFHSTLPHRWTFTVVLSMLLNNYYGFKI